MLAMLEHVDRPRRLRRLRRRRSRRSPRTRRSRPRCTANWPRCSKPDAILASNTSTISITRMADSRARPVAVRRHALLLPGRPHGARRGDPRREDERRDRGDDRRARQADPEDADRRQRLPGVPREPRAVPLYERGACCCSTEGASMDAIDKAATKFGMPMGPIALEDLVGLDTACYAGHVMLKAYPDRAVPVPILDDLVKAGRLGQKSGAGSGSSTPRARPRPTPRSTRSSPSTRPATTFPTRPRSPTGCSWRCCWKRPGPSRKGSSASRRTPTWA